MPESRFFSTADGLRHHFRFWQGDSARLPVICLAGLSRNSRDFLGIAETIANGPEGRTVIAPDYRGRGLSDHDPDKSRYSVPVETADVIALMDHLGIEKAHIIGTSRGGLITMTMALMAPGRIASAVLNDIGPVIEALGLAAIRDYLAAWPRPKDWDQAVRALKATHGHGFPALTDTDWQEKARAIFTDRHGAIEPDYDPALHEPLKAIDFSVPLPDLWAAFPALQAVPLLSIRGEHSILLSAETVAEMARRHPDLTVHTARGQAHAPILDGHGVDAAILAFLADKP